MIGIVTGANKGIGLETCRALVRSGKFSRVYLTSRNTQRGHLAVNSVQSSIVHYHQLDIGDKNSIKQFRQYITDNYNGFDVLVQNAAIADHGKPGAETLDINFWGTLEMMKQFYPLINSNGRIVNVSSMSSQQTLNNFPQNSTHRRTLHSINRDLELEELEHAARQFIIDEENKKGKNWPSKNGKDWPKSAYGVSKVLVNGITRIYAKRADQDKNGVLVNCCCPGYVRSDMTRHNANATKDPTEGASTSLWLALLPPGLPGPQGCYLADA